MFLDGADDLLDAAGNQPEVNGRDIDRRQAEPELYGFARGHLLEFVPPEEYDDRFKRWRLADLPIIPEAFKRVAHRLFE